MTDRRPSFAELSPTASRPEDPTESGAVATLSVREREIMMLVASGKTDMQIAEALHVRVRTVRSHLDRIRDKTGLRRRAELATYVATQLGDASKPRVPTVLSFSELFDRTSDDSHRGEFLRSPIGVAEDGRPVYLDLKQAAEGGFGPHGVISGTTGTGKSELLETIVLSLAFTHSPEDLQFITIDPKGGVLGTNIARLPHTAATVSQSDDETVSLKFNAFLSEELARRQKLLAYYGRTSISDGSTRTDSDEPRMPHLLIVIDDFSRVADGWSGLERFITLIASVGRSLGIHLLVADQSLRQYDALLASASYRVCLSVTSPLESEVLTGSQVAARGGLWPGEGFLSTPGQLTKFRAAMVTPGTAWRGPAADEFREAKRSGFAKDFAELVTRLDEARQHPDRLPERSEVARPRAPANVDGVRLFISHSSTDLEVAESVKLRLEEIPGISCFFLATDVSPGDDWEDGIRRAARECDAIVCLVTPDYIRRPWFYAEWAAFWFQKKKTWYLLMLDTTLDDVFEPMRRRQTAFLNDRRSVELLLASLANGAEVPRGLDLVAAETVQSVVEAKKRQIAARSEANLAVLATLMQAGEDNVSRPLVEELVDSGHIDQVLAIAKNRRSDGPTKRRQLGVLLVERGYSSAVSQFDHLIQNNAERRTVGVACEDRLQDHPQDTAAMDLMLKIYRAVRDPQRKNLRDHADGLRLQITWPDIEPNP